MVKLAGAALAAVVLCAAALAPSHAAARAGAAGFFRGVLPANVAALRAAGVRPFLLRRAFRSHHAHHHHAAGAPVVFGPAFVLADAPPADSYGPRPPAWRECIAETTLVPSVARGGFVPVAVTRCWRRN